ncbi:transposase [Candidatus Vondammii sp. HM_W22]|uniref:transposase n=1 Tax=Candidatus Vondammii sp. HM_W22 TaxID=2687299 RepID=UPI001F13786E|nr:transposase [Candidatus Vondammii sp. HM_W22]
MGAALRHEVITSRQKNVEAHWIMKHGKTHYGYKNHISIDRKQKVIRKYAITSAEVHDSQVFEERLDENNSKMSVWAGSAYRSQIYRRSTRKRPLNEREQEADRK